MDVFLILLASLFLILGIIGSFLPILPGPITSWFGFLILYLSDVTDFSISLLITTFIIALIIWVLDFFIPAIGTKKFGGSKYGVIGTTIGLIIGVISPIPFGILIGPFLGALAGELINKSKSNQAIKAAFGSFLGFLASSFIKFIVSLVYFGVFIKKVLTYIFV
tara:strand:- start:3076 stop:3567 length:492 start_codon:yes stop_codon:yes gene_type:complete